MLTPSYPTEEDSRPQSPSAHSDQILHQGELTKLHPSQTSATYASSSFPLCLKKKTALNATFQCV